MDQDDRLEKNKDFFKRNPILNIKQLPLKKEN